MTTAAEIIATLGLKPLEPEGGFFLETYRAAETIGPRNISTAIYYLLTPDTFSAIHRVASDEIFHFYCGDPVEMVWLKPDGTTQLWTLGSRVLDGMHPQLVVPRGVWQGSRLAAGGKFALLGCTVAPGFDYADYEHGNRTQLIERYPARADLIASLTHAT